MFCKYFGRTFFPPYWALGFQISRYGYKNLTEMKQVLERFDKFEIPLVIIDIFLNKTNI
jgi:alpha-glucosidase (family GH31 glycosyl hydrolase)